MTDNDRTLSPADRRRQAIRQCVIPNCRRRAAVGDRLCADCRDQAAYMEAYEAERRARRMIDSPINRVTACLYYLIAFCAAIIVLRNLPGLREAPWWP